MTATARTSANTEGHPGLLVSCCGAWYRLTHTVDGVWHGVRLGVMDHARAQQHEHPRAGTMVWPVPRPWLLPD